ncbi:MAG: hypothetical protein JSV19_09680 [Phycisphaerales bacterium]|nr:MAG: hypothetical protein JSV19_09680 [Phycisphaerales bacterium]
MHQHNDHPHAAGLPAGRAALYQELVHHLPFSVSAVAIGLTIAGIICFLAPLDPGTSQHDEEVPVKAHPRASAEPVIDAHADHDHHQHVSPFRDLFHLFHPLHMLFSAAATTAMFWRYERRAVKAVVIGLIGAIGVCGLSDIVMPHMSLMMLRKAVPWHICVIEHPQMVLSFAAVGVIVGLSASVGVRRSTFFSHSLHVFSSTMASIFYLIGPFGHLGWIDSVGVVFLFIIVAVMVPCCLSDIVFPLLLTGQARDRYCDAGEHAGGG